MGATYRAADLSAASSAFMFLAVVCGLVTVALCAASSHMRRRRDEAARLIAAQLPTQYA